MFQDERHEKRMRMKYGYRKDFYYILIIDTRVDPPREYFREKQNAFGSGIDFSQYLKNCGVTNWASFRKWMTEHYFNKANISSAPFYTEEDATHTLFRVVITKSGGIEVDQMKWERLRVR